jgi:hypothetical protein
VLKEAKELYNEWSKMLFPQKWAIVETITEYITIEKDKVTVAISHLSSGSRLTSQHDFRVPLLFPSCKKMYNIFLNILLVQPTYT